MDRLIINYEVGDYEYSATITKPLIYENKVGALTDLEMLLTEKVEKLNELIKEKEEKYSIYEKENNKLVKILNDKRVSQKEKKEKERELIDNIQKKSKDLNNVESLIKEIDHIEFGGQTFSLSNLSYYVDESKEYKYVMPEILTLEEYYLEVENNLGKNKKFKI